jgi:deoxyadenosine/deoxycytidine kinase
MERLKDRQRSEEMTVESTYLFDIHNLYEQWFCPSEKFVREVHPPVLVIDGNRTNEEVFKDAKTQIQNFLSNK